MISPRSAPSRRTSRASVSRLPEVPMLRGSARSGRGGVTEAAEARAGRLAGPELAVAGVAEARHDVALVVQLPVERGAVDLDVRMSLGHRGDSLRRGDQVDELDPDRVNGAPALEDLDRGGRRAPGREHG